MGLYTVTYSIANIVAPLMGSQIIDRLGFTSLWLCMAALSALSLVGFYFLEKKISGTVLSLHAQNALPAD